MGRATGTSRASSPSLWEVPRALAGMLGSAARGALTTTLGLPGDIEALASEYLLGETPTSSGHVVTVLPTTEDVAGFLPQLPEGMRVPQYETLGSFVGGTPGQAVRTAARVARPVGMGALRELNRLVEQGHPLVAAASPLNVVKLKGGNWLAGQTESVLGELKRDPSLMDDATGPLALNKWIKGPLTKYVKTSMATPEDPVRALAEQGILHYDPPRPRGATDVKELRVRAGFPEQGAAATPLGKSYEDLVDSLIGSRPAGEFSGPILEENPWIGKADPKSSIYYPKYASMPEYLGLHHLTDELRNALNPESGLPRSLLLRPEQMQQMGMEKAVRHVAKINEWRAAQKAEADLARATNPATQMVKEYPEQGMKWVELKGEEGPLSEALKYEGEQMGDCVGGYCSDVLSGMSRIFSLRDARGQPHVTIETQPPGGLSDWTPEGEEPTNLFSIIQVKGKGNVAPAEKYLPMVQDFVKSQGPWSSVGDIQNTGLRHSSDVFNEFERRTLQDYGSELGDYLTQQEIEDLHALYPTAWRNRRQGMAEGGAVRPDWWNDVERPRFYDKVEELAEGGGAVSGGSSYE